LVKYYGEKLHDKVKHLTFTVTFKNLYSNYLRLGEYQEEMSLPLGLDQRKKTKAVIDEAWLDRTEPASLVPYESPRKKFRADF